MAITRVWDESFPADTQLAKLGAQDIRESKVDIRERVSAFGAGLLANRPTPEASFAGVMYFATDTFLFYRWNGATWDTVVFPTDPPISVTAYSAFNLIVPDSSYTVVPLGEEVYDYGNLHDKVTNNSRITIPSNGIYLINGHGFFSPAASGNCGIGVKTNGSNPPQDGVSGPLNPVTTIELNFTAFRKLPAGFYVELGVFQSSGGPLSAGELLLSVHKLFSY